MDPNQPQNNQLSQLFTVRVWSETLGSGQTEVRGEVRHVLSGETHYFREWPALITYVVSKLEAGQAHDP